MLSRAVPISAFCALLFAGAAVAKTDVPCPDLSEAMQQQIAGLLQMSQSAEKMLTLLESQISALEAQVDRGENVSQSYAILDNTYVLKDKLTAQRDDALALISESCPSAVQGD